MGKINIAAIACLSLTTCYFMWENKNSKQTITWMSAENRMLKDDNHALRDIVLAKANERTYQEGITDALVRMAGPNGKEFAESYVSGYHAAMNQQQKIDLDKIDAPKNPETEKISQK